MPWKLPWPFPNAMACSCGRIILTTSAFSAACARFPNILNASVQLELALSPLTAETGIISTVSLRCFVLVDPRSTSDTHYRTVLCFPPDHPSFPGHFPDHPLVPGVLVLECVAQALRDWRNQRLARVREAKFLAPLYPEETAELELMDRSGQIRFEMRRGGKVLARGVIEGEA